MIVPTAPPGLPFLPLGRTDGYLPIEDFGLIGDGSTAGLVGRDGTVAWLCVPRFDSDPLFCSILDAQRGGFFSVAPAGLQESRQYYEGDSGVLVTEMRGDAGLVQVVDALAIRNGADLGEDVAAARGELLRFVRVLEGSVQLHIRVQPHGDFEHRARDHSMVFESRRRPELQVQLWSSQPLPGATNTIAMEAGDTLAVVLRWGGGGLRYQAFPEETLAQTLAAWRQWSQHIRYEGPQTALVRRSAITLKLLEHFETGALVAAPTSSLPEAIGGTRNWDYRYAWIRDAAYSVYALNRVGLGREAAGFLGWVFNAFDRGYRPRVLYDIDARSPVPEREDGGLEGYRKSRPVRWGNAAADQEQHDVYGEIMDCAYQWAAHHGEIDKVMAGRLRHLAEAAAKEWRTADHGIWEVRTGGRPFTYSAAMCHVALDRAARMAERMPIGGDVAAWRAEATRIRTAILNESWDEHTQSLTEHLGGGGLDASLLAMPLRRVIRADHPRMVATADAITRRLGAGNGLLYRYLPEESPDGIAGHEGAFLLCSFWLVDNLTNQGRLDEALELYDSLCARANPLGLLPEQIDPTTGAFLGNFPQAFSHVGVISSGFNLARAMRRRDRA